MLDLRLPDMTGFEVLERIRDDEDMADVPVVVFTGRELSPEEDARLHTMARSVVVKGWNHRSVSWMKRRCSFTGWWAICHRKSETCLSGCTARMRT